VPSGRTMIEIQALTKYFGTHCALDGLTLSIPAGEICGLLGPNGAGKTTTIRTLAGLVRPSAGRIMLGGYDIQTHAAEAKRMLAYVPDRPYLYEKLTGYEFISFVGGLYDLPPLRSIELARPFVELLGLAENAGSLIESYSHGMKQKLMLCSALMHDPKIFVVDEPMVGLDPSSSRKVSRLIRELGARGVTILMSTHTLSVAERVCDRIAILNRGKLVALGGVDELMRAARVSGGSLEEVFLKLTEEEEAELQAGEEAPLLPQGPRGEVRR
jgi:ABC-2 type transport system ATP-binding protein